MFEKFYKIISVGDLSLLANLSVFNRYEKKNLFNVKYVRVYLMLNALKMKSFDYKSIALPAELQGLKEN